MVNYKNATNNNIIENNNIKLITNDYDETVKTKNRICNFNRYLCEIQKQMNDDINGYNFTDTKNAQIL